MSDLIQCGCGSLLKKITSAHRRTKKHQKWLEAGSPPLSQEEGESYDPNLVQCQAERYEGIKDDEDEERVEEHLLRISGEHQTNYKAYCSLTKGKKAQFRASVPAEDRLPFSLDGGAQKAFQRKKVSKLTEFRKEKAKNPLRLKQGESEEDYQDRLLKLESKKTKPSKQNEIRSIMSRRRELVN